MSKRTKKQIGVSWSLVKRRERMQLNIERKPLYIRTREYLLRQVNRMKRQAL